MRLLFTIFTVLFLLQSAFADFTRDSLQIELLYNNDSNDTTIVFPNNRYKNTFDSNNILINQIGYERTGNTWNPYSRTSYDHDVNGRTIKIFSERWNGAIWENYSLDSSLYTLSGKLLLSASYTWTGIWSPQFSRSIYDYSTSDSLLNLQTQNVSGGTWNNYQRESHIRDISEKDSILQNQFWDGSSWVDNFHELHFRNTALNDSILLRQTWNGSMWNDVTRHVYAYDNQFRLISDTLQQFDGTNWLFASLISIEFATYGNNITIKHKMYNGADTIVDPGIYYEIDLYNRIRSVYRNWDYDDQVGYQHSTYIYYDFAGKPLFSYSSCSSCSGGLSSYYDSNGYLNKSEQSYFTMGGEYYSYTTEYYYTYPQGENILCNGTTGSLVADTALSYEWRSGQTVQQISIDTAGTYQVVLSFPDSVSWPSLPVYVADVPFPVAIHGQDSIVTVCTGNIFRLQGPEYPHTTYQWLRNDSVLTNFTTPTLSLGASTTLGTYRLVITNSCGTDTSSATIVQYGLRPASTILNMPPFICAGDSVTVFADTTGVESYLWHIGEQTTPSITISSGGVYWLTTTAANGCKTNSTKTNVIQRPLPITPDIIRIGNSLSILPTTNLIHWYLNGVIISGATSTSYTPTQDANYTVTLSNAWCSASDDYNFISNSFSAEAGHNVVLCFGENVMLGSSGNSAFGGTPPYTFSWFPDSTLTNANSETPTAHPYFSTTYFLTVTDNIGNVDSDSVYVQVEQLPNVNLTSSTGSFNFCQAIPFDLWSPNVAGINYHWFRNNQSFGYGITLTVYQSGNYKMIATSTNGCMDTSVVINSIQYLNPPNPVISLTGQPIACGGQGVGFYTNYIPSFQYQWWDEYGNTYPGETDTIFFPQASGNKSYVLVVTDTNQCTALTQSRFFSVDSELNVAPIIRSDSNFCRSSEVQLAAVNPEGYSIQWMWNNYEIPSADSSTYIVTWPGNYQLELSNGNGCIGHSQTSIADIRPLDTLVIVQSGSNLFASGYIPYNVRWFLNGVSLNVYTPLYHPLQPGIYTVVNEINSSAGYCGTFSLPFEVVCTIDLTKKNVSCSMDCTGSAEVNFNGNATPSITWSTGSSDTLISQLCAGYYSVRVQDSLGCDISDSVFVDLPDSVQLDAFINSQVSCFGNCNGSILMSALGGSGIYSWKLNGVASSYYATNLCEGNYLLSVDDGNGCSDTMNIQLSAPPEIVVTTNSLINPSCNGICNGEIMLTASGGTGSLLKFWNDGVNGQARLNLCTGVYIFTAADNNNCRVTDTFNLIPADTLESIVTVSEPTCFNSCDGLITANISGGTPPYDYLWMDGSQNDSIYVCSGNASLTVNDVSGCVLNLSQTVGSPDPLILNATTNGTNCIGCADGNIYLNYSGGTPPYSFQMVPSGGVMQNDTITGLFSGIYYLTIRDFNICTTMDTVFINEDPTGISTIPDLKTPLIWPNPFNTQSTLILADNNFKNKVIRISDVNGKMVRSIQPESSHVIIYRDDLTAGLYFISIVWDSKIEWTGYLMVAE